MQNKGAFRFLAILIALACLFQLSFTLCTRMVEKDAKEYAATANIDSLVKTLSKNQPGKANFITDSLRSNLEARYLDSMSSLEVYNFAWIRKYSYKECKERELNLGLDLKGGMNVTLEISIPEIIRALSNQNKDPLFVKTMNEAIEMQKHSDKDFMSLFEESFKKNNTSNAKLASFFIIGLKDRITFSTSDDDVLKILRSESKEAVDRTYKILRTRIDRFGVAQPNVQLLATTGRILIELPGVKDPARVRKLLQGTANLEFWNTYENNKIYPFIEAADKKITAVYKADTNAQVNDSANKDDVVNNNIKKDSVKKKDSLLVSKDTNANKSKENQSFEEFAKDHPLIAYLRPYADNNNKLAAGPVIGLCQIIDTGKVGAIMRMPEIKSIFPKDFRFAWTFKPMKGNENIVQMIALRATRDGSAALDGSVIVDARQDIGQDQGNEISMSMNSEGAQKWKGITAQAASKDPKECIAIVLDGYVYSFPTVQNEIPNGRSSITGGFTIEEAQDLANILKAGKLPAVTKIVSEDIVGPSLGKEAINSGMLSFVFAFLLVLFYMILYYNRGGVIASIALVINLFFLFGVLASLGSTLTLPGIAGIVLTLGMAVDANVIIYERIKEEVRAGKGMKLAIADGYKHAYSAIIDGNVTTILTGIVLLVFGSGPVKGFAVTLIIGILTSLFTAIFISRLIFETMLKRNWKINFANKFTLNAFTKLNFDFIGARKKLYIVSLIIIVAGIVSLFTKGLNYGVDFTGGRTYVVRFDQPVKTENVRQSLVATFGEAPEVKTLGSGNQVKITTKYLINQESESTDSIVESKLYDGVKSFYSIPLSKQDFLSEQEGKAIGKLSSQKVGPTIADDIRIAAVWAIVIALIVIFIYIAFRFKKWQYGLGGVISLAHDTMITISMYSIFYGILPFTMEVDQAFIAAILTIIGYSINDTVIIFDRVREYNTLYPKRSLKENMNGAMNSTLGRTVNTSGTTIITLLAMFIFGGEIIRGFIFALLVGIVIGTYSSIFNATPVAYDFINLGKKRREKQELLNK